jgi:very-short-patch-repair endonuclease
MARPAGDEVRQCRLPGVREAWSQAPKGAMRSRSSNEVALERALRKHLPVDTDARRLKLHDGLPRPIVEVDIVVPELRLVIEYDGAYWHRGRDDHDRRKTSRLIAAGLNVIRIRDDGLAPLDVGESVSIERQLTSDDIARLVLNLLNPREQRRRSRIFLRRMPRDRTDDLPRASVDHGLYHQRHARIRHREASADSLTIPLRTTLIHMRPVHARHVAGARP